MFSASLPDLTLVDEDALPAARQAVRARPLAYPLGSGQAEEIALLRGLRPAIRQLLSLPEIEAATARFERLGLACVRAERPLGATQGGLARAPSSPAELRLPLFVGRDRGHLEAARAAELSEDDAGHMVLGRLLGYPRCCVEAFVATPAPRRSLQVLARTLAATRGPLDPLLNVLDLGVFHFVSWFPCAFDCGHSRRYAAAVRAAIAAPQAAFVRTIERLLAAHRLVLNEDVQLSVRGSVAADALTIAELWPTARDRHPRARLPADDVEITARAFVALRPITVLRLERTDAFTAPAGTLAPGVDVPVTLFPFGAVGGAPLRRG